MTQLSDIWFAAVSTQNSSQRDYGAWIYEDAMKMAFKKGYNYIVEVDLNTDKVINVFDIKSHFSYEELKSTWYAAVNSSTDTNTEDGAWSLAEAVLIAQQHNKEYVARVDHSENEVVYIIRVDEIVSDN